MSEYSNTTIDILIFKDPLLYIFDVTGTLTSHHHFIIPPEGKLFHRSRSERCELCHSRTFDWKKLNKDEMLRADFSENDSSSLTSHVRCGDYTTSS